jgi:TBC1 domain family protein 5
LDDGKIVSTDIDCLAERIQALEQRNKALAKTLQNAMDDLSAQQKKLESEDARLAADALTLAIARLQFIQVYLEDSSIPIIPESTKVEHEDYLKDPKTSSVAGVETVGHMERPVSRPTQNPVDSSAPTIDDGSNPNPRKASTSPAPPKARPPPVFAAKESTTSATGLPSPFHQPRPSLALSSFSWMLGEDQNKPSFVSATPFAPEQRRESLARGDKAFLFGEEKANGKDKGTEREEDNYGFTMGTLKGLPKSEGVKN